MDKKMFCFQCEQTVGCTGCTGNAGVCGKKADTAKLQDELTGALISLAKAADSTETISKRTGQIIIEGLFTTVTNVNFDNAAIENMIQKVRTEKERLISDCNKCQAPYSKTEEYDLQQLWNANEDIRSLKSLILFGIRGMAAYAYHANVLNYEDAEVNQFFCEALSKIGYEENTEALLSTVLKTGEINLKCMALLDKANTETYGTPEPTDVTLTVEKGPFIVVTGHDLKDLQLLLEQTEGKGINIYTHGEMLPAHAYPFLKKYSHLKGNFGTAWQNQQKEFDHLPAPVQQAAQMPAMQETAYYEPPTAQPVPEPTESAQAQGEKVDTVEFAIAPHPEEPEEAEPAPIPVEEPAIDETRFQDVSGLYDEPEAKPARRRKAGTTRRTTRKKASDEPQEELNSPAFDNFEGVDFDS